jgi:hypothetical protein
LAHFFEHMDLNLVRLKPWDNVYLVFGLIAMRLLPGIYPPLPDANWLPSEPPFLELDNLDRAP